MHYKILTVDDSKTVRTIVRKAFKNYDCEVLEASNGVEGLTCATDETPHLILLDVTMPVMDGITMLNKLKADPHLRSIPVVMLTAEGGRENVLKIAKIGIRDYMIKPFHEDLLVSKVARIVDLKPRSLSSKVRSIFDPADLLVIDDKPAIAQQIQDGLKQTPWKVATAKTAPEASEAVARITPDVIILSLSLPEGAFAVYQELRKEPKLAQVPIIGLALKTDAQAQQTALQQGFNAVITKPLEIADLESKIAKALHLDTSQRYFSTEGDVLLLRIPEAPNQLVLNEIAQYLKPKTSDAVDGGIAKAVIDVHEIKHLDMILFRLISQAMQICRDSGLQFALVGNALLAEECRGFEDTKTWQFVDTVEDAKAQLARTPVAASVSA